MGLHRRHRLHGADHSTIGFWSIYPLSLLFVFHTLLVAYINSAYMEQFLSPEGVGLLYTVGSALAVLAFLFFTHALQAIGNVGLTLILAIIDIFALATMGAATESATAITAFVIFLTVNPLLYLNIDIFSETIIGNDESSTGSKRGLTLTLMSIASTLAPLTMSELVSIGGSHEIVYFAAAGVFVLFVGFVLVAFRDFHDPHYEHLALGTSLRSLWKEADVRNVMLSHLLLQMFFAWAVIYVPLYMATEIGFTWEEIGYIISFGLFAYVLFEWPIGVISDRWLGEKEIMALGFVVLAVSSSWITFMVSASIFAWMVLIFITRIGAAMVEATTESYFFKHTNGSDADTIGFFRLLRPLASVFGALLGSAALLYLPFNLIFVVLGLMMVPGIYFTTLLKDTK